MMKNDLKKFSRSELIDVIYQLKRNEQELQRQIQTLQAALADRKLKMEQAGSVAEAALAVTGVFESAQQAADTYLAEIRRRHAATDEECARQLEQARKQANAIVQEALRQQQAMEQQYRAAQAEQDRVEQIIREFTDGGAV